jgi:magnesium transporter
MAQKDVSGKKWPWGSAGRNMITNVPIVPNTFMVSDVLSHLRAHIEEFESIDYIYVLNEKGDFVGVLSIKDLYRKPLEAKVTEIYRHTSLVSISPLTDQQEITYNASKHGIKSLPVVDDKGGLLGVVPSNRIQTILYHELREDVLRMAGIHGSHASYDNILEAPVFKSFLHRIPWLVLGIIGGLLAAQVIGIFDETLEASILLAAFLPLVLYIPTAVGGQLSAMLIRDFAITRKLNFAKYFFKQFIVVVLIAVSLGLMGFIAVVAFYNNLVIARVLGAAIAGGIISSMATGMLIPLAFRKLGFDPADASGPVANIAQDITSVLIYLVIASALI